MTEPGPYPPVSRPYEHRYRYVNRRHVFDKMRSLDLELAEFQLMPGDDEIVAETPEGPLETKELVLLVACRVRLHVVIDVDVARGEERLVTVYEPDPDEWTADMREETLMRCETCGNGKRRPACKPYVAQQGSRVAVVTDVPAEECAACGEIWFDEQVALTLDALLTEMLTMEIFAVRPYPQAAPSAA